MEDHGTHANTNNVLKTTIGSTLNSSKHFFFLLLKDKNRKKGEGKIRFDLSIRP